MHKYRRLLRKRAIVSFIDGLIIFLVLLLMMVARNPVPPGRAISYLKTPGHILVQLAKLPGVAEVETRPAPEWTLYGDGTLIFRAGPGDDLWRAQLSPRAIQQILDVIIHHNTFFATSEQRYSRRSDDDQLLLSVDANGQQKEVTLVSEPATRGANDIQTTHLIAIEQFLLTYHPVHAVLYASNSGPDDDDEN